MSNDISKIDLSYPILVGDIGGTNARFRMVFADGEPSIDIEPVKTADFPSLEAAIETAVLSLDIATPKTAIIAAAGPIKPDGLDLTNAAWTIRPAPFFKSLGIGKLILLNDFEAQALSLPNFGSEDLEPLGPKSLQPKDLRTKVVLGPGTGLGVALLVHAQGRWFPVAGEGGHVDLGPRTDRETKIWHYLQGNRQRVSAEDVLCGRGIANLYRAVCQADDIAPTLEDAADITKAALAQSDAQAKETITLFCILLGRVAGDLALISKAEGGVYLAGGISGHIASFLKAGGFRSAFENKAPHESLMKRIATTLVECPQPALLGLESYAKNPDQYGLDIAHRSWEAP